MNKQIIYLASLFLIILTSCTEVTNYQRVEKLIAENYHVSNLENFEKIVVINEMGQCITCNQFFAKQIGQYIENPKTLFIVCSSGAVIDISTYLSNKSQKNIILDYQNKFKSLNLISKCAIIELNNEEISKITEINLDNLESEILEFN